MPYRLVFAARDGLLDAARALEADGKDGQTFGRYEYSSLFLAVVDAAGEVVGAARVILPGPAGLKTINDLPEAARAVRTAGIDPDRTWDVASFTVREGSRALVAAALCHGLVQMLRANRVRAVVATLDADSRRMLSTVGLLPGSLPGTGTPGPASAPMWAPVSELLDLQRTANRDGYRLVSLGIGLEGVRLPPRADLLVTSGLRLALASAAIRELAPTA